MTAAERAAETVAALAIVTSNLFVARDEVASHFPLSEAAFNGLSRQALFATDSMLKRFENAQDIAQHQLFRVFLDMSGEDVTIMSNVDIAHKLEKFGALPSARAWREYAGLRNRLAHIYPLNVQRQLKSLNDTFEVVDDLVAAIDSVISWGRGKGFVP